MTDSPAVLSRRSAFPWGFVGMLVLVALGEWAFTRVEMDVIGPWNWDWRLGGEAVTGPEAVASEVLCFGDSLLKFSVLPAVVEGRTGYTAYNLGVGGGLPPSSYFLLRRALRAGARPKAVLIGSAPFFLFKNPNWPESLRRWPELLTTAESFDLAWTARDPELFARLTAAWLFRTFRARHEVRAAVFGSLRGEHVSSRFVTAQFRRNARVNRGANVVAPVPMLGDLGANVPVLCGSFVCDPVNAAYFDRFFALAADRGIPVFWVITPIIDEVQRSRACSEYDAALDAFIGSYQRRYPNLTVLDGRYLGYGRELYSSDPVHLNRNGAIAFSAAIAAPLDRALRGERLPRRVTLPPDRARADESIAVEDLSGSAMAIAGGGKVRR